MKNRLAVIAIFKENHKDSDYKQDDTCYGKNISDH